MIEHDGGGIVELPHFNSKEYLKMLESYSNSKDFCSVRIIVGPQDSG